MDATTGRGVPVHSATDANLRTTEGKARGRARAKQMEGGGDRKPVNEKDSDRGAGEEGVAPMEGTLGMDETGEGGEKELGKDETGEGERKFSGNVLWRKRTRAH